MEQYARTLLAKRQALDRLESVQQQLSAGWQELRQLLARGCEASNAARMHEYHRSLERRRDECVLALGVAERRVNVAFQAMLAARRDREIVDKFFVKQKAHHQRERVRVEQKFLDDLAGRRAPSVLAWNSAGA